MKWYEYIVWAVQALIVLLKDKAKIVSKLKSVQSVLDGIVPSLGEAETKKLKLNIDKSDSLKSISAEIVPDKHGVGNSGLEISYKDKWLDLRYDPTDGSFKGGIKIGL